MYLVNCSVGIFFLMILKGYLLSLVLGNQNFYYLVTLQARMIITISKLSEMPWKKYEKYILAGDFNAEVSEDDLSNFLDIYGFKSLVHEKTCYKSIGNPSCKELLLTNCRKSFQD